ncbi:hypothetical protein LK996_03940 [Lysobacter sp. A6]|uniref:Uncharacterized protein n=1 Tax=Noviluteimonas lactosilytica TaxID=2888523 RepID=A0ABS8JF54_9GAMM|nr:hypothetical protein [Lysobacter lactosilyticus]MCC8362224.1 hypothetical protein [Lysobacter lactosilyticus]
MKTLIQIAALACALATPGLALAGMECFTDRKVTAVNIGYVDMPFGADGGDAVYFTLDNGNTYPLNTGFNLDWPRGQALHRTLLAAMTQRFKVTGYDHYGYGGTCDDIDEILVKP